MNWIFLSLLAPLVYTFVNFIDKYIIEHKVKDSRGMPIYAATTAIVFGTGIWLATGLPTLSGRNSLLVLTAGMVLLFAFALYFYALAQSHTSYIVALMQTIPIFTLILSIAIMGDSLNWLQFGGFFLVFAAVIGLSIDRVERRIRITKSFYAITAANMLFAVASIIIKFTIALNGFAAILAYESWGLALGGVILFLLSSRVREAFIGSLRSVSKPTLGIMFFNESLVIVAKALTFLAISLGPVALVSVLGGSQVFYGFLLGIILTALFPRFFHEDIARKAIVIKLICSIVLFIGVWCVATG